MSGKPTKSGANAFSTSSRPVFSWNPPAPGPARTALSEKSDASFFASCPLKAAYQSPTAFFSSSASDGFGGAGASMGGVEATGAGGATGGGGGGVAGGGAAASSPPHAPRSASVIAT